LGQYLDYWAWHNERLLDSIPPKRRLFVRTSFLSDRLEEIAAFLDVPVSYLGGDREHSNKTSERHGVLQRIDRRHVRDRIQERCGQTVKRLNETTAVSMELP
jgi:hypothetical protein